MNHLIKLLATDFDGTLMTLGIDQVAGSRASFQSRVNDIQGVGGCWVLCTGRDYSSFRMAYPFLECSDIAPDFIVARRGRIYERHGDQFRLRALLSLRVLIKRFQATHRVRRMMKHAVAFVGEGFEQVLAGDASLQRIKLNVVDEAAAQRMANGLHGLSKGREGLLSVCVVHSLIDVRPIGQSKGLAVTELQRVLGIAPSETLAVGDGANDISMLQPSVARWAGCPQNSRYEVIQTVTHRGGHVASENGMVGTVEVINACLRDRVSSSAMARPEDAAREATPVDHFRRHCHRSKIRELVLGGGVLVAVIVVLLTYL